ncbi:MAG: CHASE2 domain-containing protein [Elusimicrobiota bacterium]|nr:CHASE2 domain-containing protein [Endomicrobiia bacterium]MDW8166598.1 CHASE2 domain-containing protein [Elusimicrobiota bacterium]
MKNSKILKILKEIFFIVFIIVLITIAEIFLPLNNITTIIDHYVYFLSEFSIRKEGIGSCNSNLQLTIKNLGIEGLKNKDNSIYLQGCEIKHIDQKINTYRTYVLMIDEILYRDYFYSTSELDKCRLKEILKHIVKLKPKILVIDIHLSFNYDKAKFEKSSSVVKRFLEYSDKCERQLYKFIEKTQKRGITKIVMIDHSNDHNNQRYKKFPEGVIIATPIINTSLGSPLYYNFEINNLPTLAWAVLRESFNNNFSINKLSLKEFKISYSKVYFNAIDTLSIKNFEDSIIFFGGNYGYDKFITPLDITFNSQSPGVLIHAVAYKTLEESIKNPLKISQFLSKHIDILQKLILIFLGIIFFKILKFIYNGKFLLNRVLKKFFSKLKNFIKKSFGVSSDISNKSIVKNKYLEALKLLIRKSLTATISLIIFTIFSTVLIIIFVLISDFFLFKIKIHYFIVAFFIEFFIEYTNILGEEKIKQKI